MGDEPKFPSPDVAKSKTAAVRVTPSEPRAPIVVTRPDTAPEPSGPKGKLSPDEVRALLAVSEVNRSKKSKRWRRGKVIAVPTLVLSGVAHLLMSYWAIAVGLLVVGAVVWTFAPRKTDEWGGSE